MVDVESAMEVQMVGKLDDSPTSGPTPRKHLTQCSIDRAKMRARVTLLVGRARM